MGLAASQARLLSLVARKSDLEYQGQVINSRRLQLAYKTAEIARAYSDGMNDMQIMQSQTAQNASGITNATTKEWSRLNLADMKEAGFMIADADGKYVDDMYDTTTGLPSGSTSKPITTTTYATGTNKETPVGKTVKDGDEISYYTWDATTNAYKIVTDEDAINNLKVNTFTAANKNEETTQNVITQYGNGNGIDLQTGLVSGKYQILTTAFMTYRNSEPASTMTLAEAIEAYKEQTGKYDDSAWGIDWRSDTTSTFKQKYYTENDEAVAAQYEADSAEVQAQDKRLEVELKNIETQHKAVETEYEAVKKVIDKNIETSFKTFG
ncbi:MAG: hypothetical protein PHX18_08355 [Candidatus Gastranaerophilales bacterium]|nr:hypothetical protein [Candidatus Gastranaerophilales bacterium]